MILQYFSRYISFSRTFQESPSYWSTFQACANPVPAKLQYSISPCSLAGSLGPYQVINPKDRFSHINAQTWPLQELSHKTIILQKTRRVAATLMQVHSCIHMILTKKTIMSQQIYKYCQMSSVRPTENANYNHPFHYLFAMKILHGNANCRNEGKNVVKLIWKH